MERARTSYDALASMVLTVGCRAGRMHMPARPNDQRVTEATEVELRTLRRANPEGSG